MQPFKTTLRVTEGRVAFSADAQATSVATVAAGEESEIVGLNNPPTAPAAFNAEFVTLWLAGGMVSLNEPLGELTEQLERRFGDAISVDEALSGQRLTWIQPQVTNVQRALADICELMGCLVDSTDDGYRLMPSVSN